MTQPNQSSDVAQPAEPSASRPCHPPACVEIARKRNRFFTGKFLTAGDCNLEQTYFQSRRHLHHRLLHGWGIACGLGVRWGKEPYMGHRNLCELPQLVVEPGIAIDSCGRELILHRSAVVVPIPNWYRDQHNIEIPSPDEMDAIVEVLDDEPYLLCLCYDERPEMEVTPLCECPGSGNEHNYVVEHPRLALLRQSDLPGCWPDERDGGRKPPPRDRCGCPQGNCLEPQHPCGGKAWVPLARIVPRPDPDPNAQPAKWRSPRNEQEQSRDPQFSDERLLADLLLCGRPYLPGKCLTQITRINWKHGGELPLSQLQSPDAGPRLVLEFSRRIASGLDRQTFEVYYLDRHNAPEHLWTEDRPKLEHFWDEELQMVRSRATLELPPDRGPGSIVGSMLFVRLRCDFLIDCDGRAVDGKFLGGRLPSGNGTEGGTFESWFRVGREPDRPDTDPSYRGRS